ncbi:phosphopantetheine-binding protein [Mycolicibacterium neoaurum]|uniref:phosphopantetheine-binding protein n=1 Tax=Mycolicibacterium neoaurum TaxID=1795 RepID=UPI001F4CBAD3|nr:phosphopantetheine-binding protein [Mycolicibacterium neoaurum]
MQRIAMGFDAPPVEKDTDLRILGWFDSIAIIQLLSWAEGEFDVLLSDQDAAIEAVNSADSLAEYICTQLGKPV